MKIKRQNDEHPSTVIVKTVREIGRMYWTGSDWSPDFLKAKQYLRAEAERRAKKKGKDTFVATLGFPPGF